MKKMLGLLAGCCWALVAMSQSGARAKKVLFVIADGIPADVIERIHPPHLEEIALAGKYMRAHVGGDKDTYSETPTISAVGYNSLLTGTWVNKHNVWGNDIKAPNYRYWNIFRLLKDQYPDKKTAVFSSWTDNRTKLVGENLPDAGNIHLDYHADGYELDTVNFPHDRARDFKHRIDEKVTDEAAANIRAHAPDLSWVYLEYTDDMGHMHGDGPEFDSAVTKMDAQVGRLWAAIRYREQHYKEDWLIVITTDHGRDEATGRGHGGQSTRQRTTWIVLNDPHLNDYARFYTPGIVDIMPTIARFLQVRVPDNIAWETDGIPLIGNVSLAAPVVDVTQGNLDLSWKALGKVGYVKVWVTATNQFKTGGEDDYRLLATVPLGQEHVFVSVKNQPSPFYKILLQGPDNSVNVWVSPKTGSTASTPPALLPMGPAWGAVYQQRAGEYEALCLQAYNIAKSRLDNLLASTTGKPPAIITDIDETLLDNSPYAVHQALAGKTYDDSSWIAWTARVDCDTVPGALSFLKYAASKGVDIFYITNRLQVEQGPTLANLQKWGFPQADAQHLVLKQSGATSSKESRRQAIEGGHQVLLFLGDNLSDFAALFDHQPYDERRKRVEESATEFGSTFIVLPNPVYGDWEGALYNYHYPATLPEKNKILLDSLKTY